ncbi:DUF1653 domain-containing protein [Lacrimispora saccharolytica]|uniref:DUF1653 domain-containing protein n=1 Tax=Lacrimispora saccharolytica (strain ATCC 35040 / DSM 2544 / NRCC 2533 / WM1) TaxID=610130 RepID=D9R7G9_LACSW|nr:DUF1653 domain-containing protein [Lacrimispora saccharolytica]ADL03698.1 protein of unknown function DUF1653 [[Clostridium] saccharolyticum WM1]QRV18168.1 DUF1653 domain-containing protein [Lacrimispora saccharolytica]
MDRKPRPGDFYRHFKDKMYQVIAVAVHTETEEEMVVYQALYGSFGIYVRPLALFLSEVDKEKYPQVKQKYRFEKVDMGLVQPEKGPCTVTTEKKNEENMGNSGQSQGNPSSAPNPRENKNLLAFLDAGTYHEKLEVLEDRKDRFSAEELLAICEIMEIGRPDSEPEEKYYAVKRYLELQNKYEGARLR